MNVVETATAVSGLFQAGEAAIIRSDCEINWTNPGTSRRIRNGNMARLTQADLVALNRAFDDRTPEELLLWAREIFGDRVAALSSMQESALRTVSFTK